jgi:hypothetical protein
MELTLAVLPQSSSLLRPEAQSYASDAWELQPVASACAIAALHDAGQFVVGVVVWHFACAAQSDSH